MPDRDVKTIQDLSGGGGGIEWVPCCRTKVDISRGEPGK